MAAVLSIRQRSARDQCGSVVGLPGPSGVPERTPVRQGIRHRRTTDSQHACCRITDDVALPVVRSAFAPVLRTGSAVERALPSVRST
jgi:hypothetical protein